MGIQIPIFQPPSEWLPPEDFPDLSGAKEIAIDLETCDPHIKDIGPGWATGKGYVIGVAIAVEGWQAYYPIRHDGGGNFDEKVFKKWFQEVLNLPSDKIFHNAMYDVGWITCGMGMTINGRLLDTLIAAPLVNENMMRYSLNELAKHYLGESKSEALLYEAAREWGVDAKGEMYRLPPMHVGPYAEQDAAVTLKLWNHLKVEITKQELTHIFDLETRLFPVLLEMKKKGVRVNIDKAEQVKEQLYKQEQKILKEIQRDTGVQISVWEARSIAKAFDAKDITYPKTPRSNEPSFNKNFLSTHPSSIAKMVNEAREINKARTTFIDTILKHEHNGRIHAEIHQMRGESGGTVTGRFSYSSPNLQQVPARNKVLGPLIRSLFIPEEGCRWSTFDYSQQEPRILVHFAKLTMGGLRGADEVIQAYEDTDADFHQVVADMAGIDRKQAKTINLGMMYGMGKGKLSSELGLDIDDTAALFEEYHSRVPFVKQLIDQASKKAGDVGTVRTLLGRVCRFELWEPNKFGINKPLPRAEAEREYGKDIKRAFTYKSLNRLIQGSAADQTKKAMVDLYEAGYLAHIQVHDELDLSLSSKKEMKEVKNLMENCVELRVKSKVDVEVGPNWGEIKELNLKDE
jgi:DNA polymerase I-like protein with 3'-5' exonuclease and polymerase domains